MKNTLLFLFLILSSYSSVGQTFQWAQQIESSLMPSYSDNYASKTIHDGSGHLYTMGMFQGTVDFDPGPGVYNLTSNGTTDVFISKLDTNGNFVWAKSFGGTSDEFGADMHFDASGNLVVYGRFRNTVDFDPGPAVYNLSSANGFSNVFILKLNDAGNFIWAKRIGTTAYIYPASFDISETNDIYLSGSFTDSVDFDPGVDSFKLGTIYYDSYYLKLDSNGSFKWAKQSY